MRYRINTSVLLLCLVLVFFSNALNGQGCSTNKLVIKTGWDYNNNKNLSNGSLDPYWIVERDEDPMTTEPRLSEVNKPGFINTGFATNPINNWCAVNAVTSCTIPVLSGVSYYPFSYGLAMAGSYLDDPRIISYSFCIASGTNLSDLNFNFTLWADDFAKVCLNGNLIASCSYTQGGCQTIGANSFLQIGTNVISVSLYNIRAGVVHFSFDGQLTTVGGGAPFVTPNCCSGSKVITGRKFFDANANGTLDQIETFVQGWPILLKNSAGATVLSTTTDLYGNYYFTNVTPGIYVVEEGQQAGMSQTYPLMTGYGVNLVANSIYTGLDFGNRIATSDCCTPMIINGVEFLNYSVTHDTLFTADICAGTLLDLEAICSNAATYYWDFGDGSPAQSGAITTHIYAAPGIYQLTLLAQGLGCSSKMEGTVTVNSYSYCQPCCAPSFPLASLGGFLNFSATGTPTLFTAGTCPNNPFTLDIGNCPSATTYIVDFGDGTPPVFNNMAPVHTYATPGSYEITVIAKGNCISKQLVSVINDPSNCPVVVPPGCIGQTTLSVNSSYYPSATGCTWNFGDGTSGTGLSAVHNYAKAGTYVLSFTVTPGPTVETQSVSISACTPIQACLNCVGSFAPDPGDYIVSAWVREDIDPPPATYVNARLQVSFTGDATVYNLATNSAKNKVIDGWQRIEEQINIPPAATHVHFKLVNIAASGPDAYFDDIRMFPKNGQMKSYVYDPMTLRLSAVLDENNYATFYEYDEEGKLIRIKKETEKGVMTIQESMESLKKQ